MSLKVYERTLRPAYAPAARRRPDFVGQAPTGDWFVFEAKGRTTDSLTRTLREAKEQSSAIATIMSAGAVFDGALSRVFEGRGYGRLRKAA
jgi:hypothetical protein